MKKIALALSLLAATALGVGIGGAALAASPRANDPALDLELRAANAGEVLRLVIGEARGKQVEIDACVKAKIDVKLKNVPASVVEAALVHKLGLVETERDGVTKVTCAAATPAAN